MNENCPETQRWLQSQAETQPTMSSILQRLVDHDEIVGANHDQEESISNSWPRVNSILCHKIISNRKFIDIKINEKPAKLQLDCGANLTVISKSLSDTLGLQLASNTFQPNDPSGNPLKLIGKTECTISFLERTIHSTIFVSLIEELNIFGRDLMEKYHLFDIQIEQPCSPTTLTYQRRTGELHHKFNVSPNYFNMIKSASSFTRTICVEGNIGVGKTTFLNYLENQSNYKVFEEPIDKWRNLNGINLMDLMYQDPAKFSFHFEMFAVLTLLQNHREPINEPFKIMERSLHSSRHCFTKMKWEEKKLQNHEFDILQKWYDYIENNIKIEVDLFIYLRTKPEVAFQRINHRKRIEEKSISFNYIQRLHQLHDEWLLHSNKPVLILDANLNQDEIISEYQRVIKAIHQTTNE